MTIAVMWEELITADFIVTCGFKASLHYTHFQTSVAGENLQSWKVGNFPVQSSKKFPSRSPQAVPLFLRKLTKFLVFFHCSSSGFPNVSIVSNVYN